MRSLVILAALVSTAVVAQTVRPGEWETAITTDSVSMAGGDAAIARMMQGRTTRVRSCITPEQAKAGPQEMLKRTKDCRFTKYQVAGGRLSSEMMCSQPGGSTMRSSTTGSFTPTSFTAKSRMVMTGGAAMTMAATVNGRLLGPCKGK